MPPDEQATSHYRGRWYGYGPVKGAETVAFAVFSTTPANGRSLTADSFDNKKLAAQNESVARSGFIRRSTFEAKVVNGANKGEFLGVATASVENIRNIRARTPDGSFTFQALSVVDSVEADDYAAHATMGFTKVTNVSQKHIGKLRAKIRLDLQGAFSQIKSLEDIDWGTLRKIACGKVQLLIENLRSQRQ